ncbi:Transcriptional regulator, MarR family [hydrothermal vent metagenome]|uniref:Transcriptional regulator, MarR family n=1 Tax=hydrothermal vent metagenome TaxID=652676 RepID=A0A1W1BTM1_9ZZZZ
MSYLDYQIIKKLSQNPEISQRQLSKLFEVSLGKVNFVLKSFVDKGLVKVNQFKNTKKKQAYLYQLTPKGIRRKTQMSIEFLQIKIREYEKIQQEIEELKQDIK